MIGALLLWIGVAMGHDFQAGYLGLVEVAPQEWSVHWSVPREVSRLDPTALTPRLPCPVEGTRMRCSGTLPALGVDGLERVPVQVVARVQWADGAEWMGTIRAGRDRVLPRRASGVVGAIPLGLEHLLLGWDHLLLVALLGGLLRGTRRLAAVGAFTVGHALSLGTVVALGLVLPAAPVEALIAISVAWLARQGLVEPAKTEGWVGLAAGFGLLHGLGFAGALAEIGMPTDGLWPVLIGFHLGLEAAQLAWLLALAIPLWMLRRLPARARSVPLWIIGVAAMVGFFLRLGAVGS